MGTARADGQLGREHSTYPRPRARCLHRLQAPKGTKVCFNCLWACFAVAFEPLKKDKQGSVSETTNWITTALGLLEVKKRSPKYVQRHRAPNAEKYPSMFLSKVGPALLMLAKARLTSYYAPLTRVASVHVGPTSICKPLTLDFLKPEP